MSNELPPGTARTMTQEEVFDAVALKAGKTTIMQPSPNGGMFIWVTKHEADPLTALMSAALSIMVRRGHNPDSKSGVAIRRVTEVVAPGCDVYWQVTDPAGAVIASGYAKDEHEASAEVAKHMRMRPALPTDIDAVIEETAQGLWEKYGTRENTTWTSADAWAALSNTDKDYWRNKAANP